MIAQVILHLIFLIAKMRHLFKLCIILVILDVGLTFKIDELSSLVQKLSKVDIFTQDFDEHVKYLEKIEPNYFNYTPFDKPGFKFECDPDLMKSQETPTSVHQLRPGDIKVVGAMGDSLTAALGANAKTILGLLIEYRGRSWSIGGDKKLEKQVTMPNILKIFNQDVQGFSHGVDIAFVNEKGVGFNAAVSGQEANHIPDQARTLINRLKESTKIDYKKDWKLITLFIGANDLCDFCKDRIIHSPKAYISYIQEGLDLIKKELPRTFVNLVLVLRVTDVKLLNRGLVCNVLHHIECPCAAFPKSEAEEKELEEYYQQYHDLTVALVDSGRYDTSDDFTVVTQPFFQDFEPPRLPSGEIDFSFFAPDCFHFSKKGHGKLKYFDFSVKSSKIKKVLLSKMRIQDYFT
jgi:phospholipase B1